MAITFTGKVDLAVVFNGARSGSLQSGVVPQSWNLSDLQTTRLANGTSAGQADRCFFETATALAASTSVDRDFAGSLTDPEGSTVTFVKVKLLIFYNHGTTSMTIKGKAGASFALFTGTTDSLTIGPGACIAFFDPVGVTVGAGTTDKVTITNSSGSTAASFDFIVGGTSA